MVCDKDVYSLSSAGIDFPSVDAYAEWVKGLEALKAGAESEFLFALRAGKVLVEHWLIGLNPSHRVWTGNEYGLDGTAGHVANRFRAGWTRVEVMDREDYNPADYVCENPKLSETVTLAIGNGTARVTRIFTGTREEIDANGRAWIAEMERTHNRVRLVRYV